LRTHALAPFFCAHPERPQDFPKSRRWITPSEREIADWPLTLLGTGHAAVDATIPQKLFREEIISNTWRVADR